ncbi:CMP-N-acetylneuraminic acid synthetase [Alteromonas sp. 76-1]|uniref:acylneuraminate cytidylyltransferase family protein n=1 Tax=Alteromonas sp. 76-1 TaxID=2358187 RepID=UPI000FD16B57|nr:acylneuraminate cytidylyltransferase family protein [Alteromonas sp. 76-1]VEL98579.1 CMP-N-acetylneuraminic acid synthetase [Alteromonas sp. 76-1]
MLNNISYNVLVPCRRGSQRIKGKNTKDFADVEGGLLALKLRQLGESKYIDTIIVSTDDEVVLEIANGVKASISKEMIIEERPAKFATSDRLDEFVEYVSQIMPQGVCIWTHVTSPFFGSEQMDRMIEKYNSEVVNGDCDSLFTVTKEQTFTWDSKGQCISHDRAQNKWPQTQDLPPLYFANSAAFVIEKNLMIAINDRIGENPYMYEVDKMSGFDIDWPEDFILAEQIFKFRNQI